MSEGEKGWVAVTAIVEGEGEIGRRIKMSHIPCQILPEGGFEPECHSLY